MAIEWETPQDFFNELNKEFRFNVDVCAVKSNAKVSTFFSPDVDGLSIPWIGNCWMNPPYDKTLGNWVQKAYNSAQNGATVVCLLPCRSSDTKWFHRYIMKSSEFRYVKGRLQFSNNGKVLGSSTVANLVVVFRPYCIGPPVVSNITKTGRPCNKAVQRTLNNVPLT